MISNRVLYRYVNQKTNTQKYWLGWCRQEQAWTMYGRLSDDLDTPKTSALHCKTFKSDTEASTYIVNKSLEKQKKGYSEYTLVTDWMSDVTLQNHMNSHLASQYQLGIRVDKGIGCVMPGDFRQAAVKTQEVLDLWAGDGFKHSLRVDYSDGVVRVQDGMSEIMFGTVPHSEWESITPEQQEAILERGMGYKTYLNPRGRGMFMVSTACQLIDLPVRLMFYQLADKYVSINDTFKMDYSSTHSFSFDGFELFEWHKHGPWLKSILKTTGFIKTPVGSNERVLELRRSKLTGALRIS